MSAPALPSQLDAIRIPKFLSPSRFGDLLSCRLSVLYPPDVSGVLPTAPVAVLGTVLHHVVREVGEGRWGDERTARQAFDRILVGALAELDATPVALDVSVGRQRWFTRIARARSWALQDAPPQSIGKPRELRLSGGSGEGPTDARVDLGHEAWIVWPNGRLRGRADRVETRRDRLRVTENKSGAIYDRDGSLIEGIALQVRLYALAIESVASAQVETVIRQDENVNVPWDETIRSLTHDLLEQQLALLPESAVMDTIDLATPGVPCRRCSLRPVCSRYMADAPKLWVDTATAGRMPLDVWGELERVAETSEAIRVELRDDVGRLVVVDGLSHVWRIQDLKRGDRVYFFGLEADQDRQHAERVQPSNLRERAPASGSHRRHAYGLQVFRSS